MKRLISFIAFALILAFINNLTAQTPSKDVVYLKNGSIIEGVITEINPNVNLKMKTSDGSLFVFDIKDIDKIIKAQISQPQSIPMVENQIVTKATEYRNPEISTFFSFLIPGIGQVYNGQPKKGAGHFSWYIASCGILLFSLNEMNYNDFYDQTSLTEDADKWGLIGLISGISGLTCWILSMVDANQSANEINRQLGFASFQLGKQTNLSFNPDIKFVNDHSKLNSRNISPSYGLNMRISF